MIEGRISDPETMAIVTSQTEKQRKKKNMKKWKIIYKNCGKVNERYKICIIGIIEEKEKGTEEKFKVITAENFPK